ncbi:hypothetical protein [uncultured Algimonas sp.]|uniref:hypothetical protein n=1 Tax=uncultured Algimonas sp. TaxID=1547920 RepID=UPI0026036520|nr:hypothetical protein [uncultured Algimonas sp.]
MGQAGPAHARFVRDDSYLSHYMRFDSWTLDLAPQPDGRTQATLSVGYERRLAPSWYFGPLQRRAMSDGLDYALAHILGADPDPGRSADG